MIVRSLQFPKVLVLFIRFQPAGRGVGHLTRGGGGGIQVKSHYGLYIFCPKQFYAMYVYMYALCKPFVYLYLHIVRSLHLFCHHLIYVDLIVLVCHQI